MNLNSKWLSSLPEASRNRVIDGLTAADIDELKYDWHFWARDKQRIPDGDWNTWLIMAGRGFGKTRTGGETVREWDETGQAKAGIALVGATISDVREIMVTGKPDAPGLLGVYPPDRRPEFVPSRRLVRLHSGAICSIFTGEEPDGLRGPQHAKAWVDELPAFQYPQETWDMLNFGLRMGENPQAVVTTTPKPIPLIRELAKSLTTHLTRGTTYENHANLAQKFIDAIIKKYEGTRLGRQELEGLLLDDVEGALWTLALIESGRVSVSPELTSVYVGVDPSVAGKDVVPDGSKRKRDDCGIVVAGRVGPRKQYAQRYVLGDYSLNAPPEKWAVEVVRVYWLHKADAVIAEGNNGGDLVRMAIHQVDSRVNVRIIPAKDSKQTRAEPVAMSYERGEVHHVGAFPKLEDEMSTWIPDGSRWSPNRIDALVWAIKYDMEHVTGGVFV